jgi:hypothetical protein
MVFCFVHTNCILYNLSANSSSASTMEPPGYLNFTIHLHFQIPNVLYISVQEGSQRTMHYFPLVIQLFFRMVVLKETVFLVFSYVYKLREQ